MFDYLSFLNVNSSSNLRYFLAIFNSNVLGFMPNPLVVERFNDIEYPHLENEGSQVNIGRVLQEKMLSK